MRSCSVVNIGSKVIGCVWLSVGLDFQNTIYHCFGYWAQEIKIKYYLYRNRIVVLKWLHPQLLVGLVP